VAIVTLLTDFGEADTYVGQVKGAIVSRCPSATLVDLSHAVPPQDIHAGAFLLWTAVNAFPPGTIHLAVVDPGVGSARRAIAIQTRHGHFLVGPDNGLLWPASERLGGPENIVQLPLPTGVSATFHGRDVFAPAAAALACARALTRLGDPIADPVELTFPTPDGPRGEVLHVDAYGNLITNFPSEALPAAFIATVSGHHAPRVNYYAEVEPSALLALAGSAGLLELSVRNGSAARETGAHRGTPVTLRTT
jgi:S-adenosylmethionine hydrolase